MGIHQEFCEQNVYSQQKLVERINKGNDNIIILLCHRQKKIFKFSGTALKANKHPFKKQNGAHCDLIMIFITITQLWFEAQDTVLQKELSSSHLGTNYGCMQHKMTNLFFSFF